MTSSDPADGQVPALARDPDRTPAMDPWRRLLDAAEALAHQVDDPGTEALAAIYMARHTLTAAVEGPREIDADCTVCRGFNRDALLSRIVAWHDTGHEGRKPTRDDDDDEAAPAVPDDTERALDDAHGEINDVLLWLAKRGVRPDRSRSLLRNVEAALEAGLLRSAVPGPLPEPSGVNADGSRYWHVPSEQCDLVVDPEGNASLREAGVLHRYVDDPHALALALLAAHAEASRPAP